MLHKKIILLMASIISFSCFLFSNNTTDLPPATPAENYKNFCSGCHGVQMEAFVDRRWKYGKEPEDLFKGIKYGYTDGGMPGFEAAFSDEEISDLVDYILRGIENVDRYAFEKTENPDGIFKTAAFDLKLDTVYSGSNVPWGLAFLPGGDLLVADRDGQLFRVKKDQPRTEIAGTPAVLAQGQGGLMDVRLHPDFDKNQLVFLSYSIFKEEGGKTLSTTAVSRARLVGDRLEGQEVIFEAQPYSTTRHHYGSRLEFDRDGYLYISVGDRGNRDENPQSLDNHCGKIHRIYDDGSIPSDNPFVKQDGAMPSIFSYGHRNPQGVSLNPADGKIWTHEHGPRGGDEINLIRKGANYGWPVISYGINYNGTTFTDKTEAEGMEQPEWYWVPSIAPCGMDFVEGNRYPGWEGSLLTGSLRFRHLSRCRLEGDKVVEEEITLGNIGRVRNVAMGPDGYIYVAVENPGYIFRLIPVTGK